MRADGRISDSAVGMCIAVMKKMLSHGRLGKMRCGMTYPGQHYDQDLWRKHEHMKWDKSISIKFTRRDRLKSVSEKRGSHRLVYDGLMSTNGTTSSRNNACGLSAKKSAGE